MPARSTKFPAYVGDRYRRNGPQDVDPRLVRGEPLNKRDRQLTPKTPTPGAVLAVPESMIASQPEFDRVSVGFP